MMIKQKSKEELQNQVEGFLEYEKKNKKIGGDKADEIFDILSDEGIDLSKKELVKTQLSDVLSSKKYEGLYKDYIEYLNKKEKLKKTTISKILPKDYFFLSSENYLINYFMDKELDNEKIEYYKNKIEKNIGILKKYVNDEFIGNFIVVIINRTPEELEKLVGMLNDVGINNPYALKQFVYYILNIEYKDKPVNEENMKLYEDNIQKNLGIIKKYFSNDWIGRFTKIIIKCPPEKFERTLLILKDMGIENPKDLIMLGFLFFNASIENINKLNGIGINTPKDIRKLRIIFDYRNDGEVQTLFNFAKKLSINSVDDLIKLDGIIHYGKKENIEVLKEFGLTSVDELIKLKKIINYGKPENIEVLKGLGITSTDDLIKLEEIINYGKLENIEVLKGLGITSTDDLIKLKDTICHGELKGMKILKELGVTSADDLVKLKGVIHYGEPERINILKELGVTSADNLVKLYNIISYGELNRIKMNIEALKELGLTSVDELIKLKDIIHHGEPERINILKELGVTSADDLVKLYNIISYGELNRIKMNIGALKELGIDSANELIKLKDIIRYLELEKIKVLKELGVTSADDLLKCKNIITGYREPEDIKLNILALKESGITGIDDLLKFQSIILKGKNPEDIKLNILALKESGITEIGDLLKFQDIVLVCWEHDNRPIPINHQRIIKNNILVLKEYGITEVDDLVKFQDIILSFGHSKLRNRFGELKEQIGVLKDIGITEVDDLVKLKHIIKFGQKENILVLREYGITEVDDLISFGDIITNHYINTKKIKNEFDIIFYERKIQSSKELTKFQNAILYGNISAYKEYFGDIKNGKINDIEIKVLSGIKLPKYLEFNDSNHKGYLKFIEEIVDTDYDDNKKSKMIEKIVTLTFEDAESYLSIFKMFDESISMDIQRIKNELIDEVLNSANPEETAEQIVNIFEKNNLPLTGKIYKVFELLYPIKSFKYELRPSSGESTLGSPVLNDYIERGKEGSLYKLIYKDLMNIAIKSGDRSLSEYLRIFVGSEKLIKKFEKIISIDGFNPNTKGCLLQLNSDEKGKLLYIFRKISILGQNYLGKEFKEGELIEDVQLGKSIVSDVELIDFYKKIKEGFNLRHGNSLYDRLQTLLYINGLKYHSADEVLEEMKESKKQAHERGLKLYNKANSNGGKIKFPEHAFLKGINEDVFPKIINRGVTSREYLGGGDDGNAAGSDCTPFDIDGLYVDSLVDWRSYGDINLIIDTNRCNIVDTSGNNLSGYKENQYELFVTGGGNHYGIRTGIPATEIDYIVYKGSFKEIEATTVKNAENLEGESIIKLSKFQKLCYEIAKNGYYIPITDSVGNIKFTPEMYHNIRMGFNYMQYYDGFDVEQIDGKWISKESDNEVNKEYTGTNEKITNERLRTLIAENSPSNEKYREFARENGELAKNTIEWIKDILEKKCRIKFNSKHDSSITGAEIHDSGSTGRGTDIPTKDVDLDFTLLLDANDYKRVDEIRKIIHTEIGTKEDDDHGVIEGGNQIKSKINNIGKSDKRPNGVPLDLLILKKSQVIDYSSSDAMKEKLNFIASNPKTGIDDLDFVRTNVIIVKKLLKAKGCYKKPEGGISGIGVENRITQHHGSFIEALESFEKVAYKGKLYKPGEQPITLEEFQKEYPMYDAGENYKDGGNDNFVYKLKENGYKGMLSIAEILRTKGIEGIEELIKKYEDDKSKYIG